MPFSLQNISHCRHLQNHLLCSSPFWTWNFSLTHLEGHEALKFSQRNRAETPGVDLMGNSSGTRPRITSLQCYSLPKKIGDRNAVCRITCFLVVAFWKFYLPFWGGRFTKFSTLIPWVSSLERTTLMAKKRLRNCWSLRPCPRIPCNLQGPGWDLKMIRGKYTKSDVRRTIDDEMMIEWWWIDNEMMKWNLCLQLIHFMSRLFPSSTRRRPRKRKHHTACPWRLQTDRFNLTAPILRSRMPCPPKGWVKPVECFLPPL